MKKKVRNGKRRKNGRNPDLEKDPEEKSAGAEPLDDPTFDEGVVEHVRMVTSLIEGRAVSREEILEMLKRTVRQHSIDPEQRIEYVLRALKKRPP